MKKMVFTLLLMVSAVFADKYKIAIDTVYPPFEYIAVDGNVAGFDVDFIGELSKRVGFEFELYKTTYDSACKAINDGKADFGISAFGDDEWTENCERGASYFDSKYILVKRADKDTINDIADLNGTKVGYSDNEFVRESIISYGAKPVKLDGNVLVSLILLLEEGKVDALMLYSDSMPVVLGHREHLSKSDKDKLEFYEQMDMGSGLVIFKEIPAEDADTFAIFPKNGSLNNLRDKIDTAIEEMKADGTMRKLLVKYGLASIK